MPEIVKFEQKVIDFSGEIEKYKLIMRKFDEQISHKAEKNSLYLIYKYVDEKLGGYGLKL